MAVVVVGFVKVSSGDQGSIEGLDCCDSTEANDPNDVAGFERASDPNDSERFISGGERSEETEICGTACEGVLGQDCRSFAMAGSAVVWIVCVNWVAGWFVALHAGGRLYKCV